MGINKMHCARTEMITVYKTSILDNQFNGKLNKLDWWIKLLFFFFRIEKNINERKKKLSEGSRFLSFAFAILQFILNRKHAHRALS